MRLPLPPTDALHPRWAAAFAALAAAWLAWAALPAGDAPGFRVLTRACGYLAALAMAVPYAHILRRFWRYRYWRAHAWLQWHVLAAYVAFALTLVHARARANGPLTLAIVVLLWAVMVSGVAGFFGLKFLYRQLALSIRQEFGLERLEPERLRLALRAAALVGDYDLLKPGDMPDLPGLCAQLATPGTPLNQAFQVIDPKTKQPRLNPKTQQPELNVSAQERQVLEDLEADPSDAESRSHFLDLINNRVLGRPVDIFRPELLPHTTGPELTDLAAKDAATLSDAERWRRNRLFLERLAPERIVPSRPLEEAVRRYFEAAQDRCLRPEFSGWRWLFTRAAIEGELRGRYQRACEVGDARQRAIVEELAEMVEQRRRMNVEYWVHRLARLWLLVHGPAAAALLVLVVVHIATSVYYGGF
jgi:hypothetical protein